MAVSCYALNSLVIMKSGEEEEEKRGGRSKTPPQTRRQVLPGLVRGSERHSSYCPLPRRSVGSSSSCSSSPSSSSSAAAGSAFLFPSAEQSEAAEDATGARGTPRRLSSPSWANRLAQGPQASPPSRSPSPSSARILQREVQNVQVTQKVGLFEAHIQAQSSGAATLLLKSPRPSRRRSPSPSPPWLVQLPVGIPTRGTRKRVEEEEGKMKGPGSSLFPLETKGSTLEQERDQGAMDKTEKSSHSPGAPGTAEMENGLSSVQHPKEIEMGSSRLSRVQDSKEAEKGSRLSQVPLSDDAEEDVFSKRHCWDKMERAKGISKMHDLGKARRMGSSGRQDLEENKSQSLEGQNSKVLGPASRCPGAQVSGGTGSGRQPREGGGRHSEGLDGAERSFKDPSFLEAQQGRSSIDRGQGSETRELPLREQLQEAGIPPCLARTDEKEGTSSSCLLIFADSQKKPSPSEPLSELMAEVTGDGLQGKQPGEQLPPSTEAGGQQGKSLGEREGCCRGSSSIPAVIVTDLGTEEEGEAGESPPQNMPIRKLSSSSASSTGFSSSWEESEEDISSDPERSLDQSPAFLQTLDKPRVDF
ncbi:UNVERIFIED_CONTAM: hypothetical protein K2H54_054592 [Gekko kuhli]